MDEERIEALEMQPSSKKRSFDAMGQDYLYQEHDSGKSSRAMSKQEQHQQRQQQQRQPSATPPRTAAPSPEYGGGALFPCTAEVACSAGSRHQQTPTPPGEVASSNIKESRALGKHGNKEVAAVFGAAGAGGAAVECSSGSQKKSLHDAGNDAAAGASTGASAAPISPPAESLKVLPAAPSEQPLSPDDIRKFEEDGFVMLKRAFEPEVAAACRDCLWKRLQGDGIRRDQPTTWVRKQGIAEIYGASTSSNKRRGRPWKDALSRRLTSAVDQLAGADKWEEFGCGWWMVTFPGFAQPPWGAEGKWHIDGAHFRHYPHSREIGILPIFLFSDLRSHGGGTAVLRGSHKKVAEILWKKAGTAGLTGPQLSGAAREALLPPADEDVIETTGDAGDVLLTHPLLLHARSTNLAPVGESGVRFMCHPAVPLKRHMDLHSAPEYFTVLERVMWRARPSCGQSVAANAEATACAGAGAKACAESPVIPTPAQCDHSPVLLRSKSKVRRKSGSGKKRRREGQGNGQGHGTWTVLTQERQQAGVVPRDAVEEQQHEQQQRSQHAAIAAEHGQPHVEVERSDLRDGPLDKGGGEQAEGDAAPTPGNANDTACLNTPDSRSANTGMGSPEYDDVVAHESEASEEVDAAVLAAMGFGGFGGSRG